MKSILLLVLVVTFAQGQKYYIPRNGLPPADPSELRAAFPSWRSIIQRLDHFSASNTDIWSMRYLENGQFFHEGGPVFIMLGAEWTIDETWIQSGQMYEMAQLHKAHMFYVEHRYYGESYPTKDLSSNNLRFLTTDQALADNAHFIRQLKNTSKFVKSKIVVFGGSYGGNMAIWMRQKYPDLVHAAVSSSAPIFAKVDFHEYHDVVRKALGTECASVITRGINEANNLLQNGKVRKIQQDFDLCLRIDSTNTFDVQYFFSFVAGQIGNVVQYSNASTLEQLCNSLQNPSILSDYERLSAFSRETQECKGNYAHLVKSMSNTSLHNGNSRQWVYQMCTQYGFFQTSFSASSLYSGTISINLYNRWCHDFFGENFTANVTSDGVAATNAKYGALNPRVTRVVSVHGTADPWHAVGLTDDANTQAPVIVVPGTSHCADLSGLSASDSPDLYKAKVAVRTYIAQWLKEE